MGRSINFTAKGPVDTLISIEELDDGTLRFDLTVLGSGLLGDLRGIFFDLKEVDASFAGLAVEGVDGTEDFLGKTVFGEARVDRVHKDVNVKGHVIKEQGKFDAGIEFGTPGKGKDDIQSASFILSANSALSLESFDLADFGIRYTSVGDDSARDDSAKIAGDASGVARNDAWEVDENTQGTKDLLENDTNGVQPDGSRKTVISVEDEQGPLASVTGGFERTVEISGLVLGTLFVSADGFATFTADGADVDKLAHDDFRTWAFTYETKSNEGNLATADAVVTIDGQNDQPIAFDVGMLEVNEDDAFDTVQSTQFGALTGDGVTDNFVATDIDLGDTLSFMIISDPTDAFGNQYGEVKNNNDGSFTFNPLDEFQFLDEGEYRDVTFQYVAKDDSGVGTSPTFPEESDTSAPATVTIRVNGSDDDPVEFEDRLLFETENQSIWNTGGAFQLSPALPFLGFDINESLDATLWGGTTIPSGDILNGLADAVEAVSEGLCTIFTLGQGDCEVDIGTVENITIPGISTSGNLAAKIGLQPYFFFNAGDVDSQVPVDVFFTAPRQVEEGDTIAIGSAYSVDGGASFQTEGPGVQFGLDFVFDVVADLTLNALGIINQQLFNFDSSDFLGTGEQGEPGFNIFDVGPGVPFEYDLTKLGSSSIELTVPDFGATGTPTVPDNTTLVGSDEEELVDLLIDVGALVSLIPGVPPFGGGGGDSISASFGDLGTVDIASFSYNWDLLSVELNGILSAVQDFSMSIEDLPLLARLEDEITEITGFSLGDDITFDVPEGSDFDVDVDGDMDGLMDFDIEVDMEALFAHESSLELDMDLILGLLRLTADFTSDFAPNQSFSLFDGLIPSLSFDPDPNDGFLLGGTIPLIEDATLATLFDDEFPLVGFNTETNNTNLFFDVA